MIDKPDSTSVLSFFAQKIAVSQNGELAAISLDKNEIEKHLFSEDSGKRLSTYLAIENLKLKKRVMVVNVTPPPGNDYYDFALSPDGSKVAVLNGRTVSVYSISGEQVEQSQ